jgi:transposase-like protein
MHSVIVADMTYSDGFREAALAHQQKGYTVKQVCETFNVPKRTIITGNRDKTKLHRSGY